MYIFQSLRTLTSLLRVRGVLCHGGLLLSTSVSAGTRTDAHFDRLPSEHNVIVLQCEDDLDGSSVQAPHTGREAHELVQICDPFRAGLGLLVGDDGALSPGVVVLDVLYDFVLTTHKVRWRGMVFVVFACRRVVGASTNHLLYVFRLHVDRHGPYD